MTAHSVRNNALATRFTFDVMMGATVYVTATNEAEALKRLDDFKGWDDLGKVNEYVSVGSCYVHDNDPELVNEDPEEDL